jgi:predicted amidohydrolase YtcJ
MPDRTDAVAGMVMTNARIYTCTSSEPEPLDGGLVIDEGVIAHVGDLAVWDDPRGLPVHDLGGRTVVPGFIDAHTHPSMVSQSSWHVRLPWTTDVAEILDFIREYAAAHPPEEAPFLYFEYYPTAAFTGSPPTKELLDSAISDRPCLCQDFSEHAHWVNSRMLELMGVTRDTPDPLPGLEMFVRDDDGEPTGLLREMVYRHFIERMYDAIGWRPPEEVTPERLAPFFGFLSSHGVTALLEALVDDDAAVAAVAELDRRGELGMHYEGAVRFRDRDDLPAAIARLRRLHEQHGGVHIRMNTLKLFLDGTNESGNSALLAPLCSRPGAGELGEIGMDAAQLADCLEITSAAAVDVHIHLVGDRAFRVACDAVEQVRDRLEAAGSPWQTRVTLAHCELVDPADMPRPAELGIMVNWTPHWSGGYFGEGSKEHLGDERWDRMYRFNEIAQSGAVVTFGSDVVTAYELHRARPLFGMQVAHTRVDPEYPLDPSSYPGSVRPEASASLPRRLLLEGYTINAARQLVVDDRMGSIEVGKLANLVVLGEDPFLVEAERLGAVPVDAVVFEGNVVRGSL